jgi:hypothetical protein
VKLDTETDHKLAYGFCMNSFYMLITNMATMRNVKLLQIWRSRGKYTQKHITELCNYSSTRVASLTNASSDGCSCSSVVMVMQSDLCIAPSADPSVNWEALVLGGFRFVSESEHRISSRHHRFLPNPFLSETRHFMQHYQVTEPWN